MLKYEKEKEKRSFKQMDKKQKCEHIWEYYRWYIIGTIALGLIVFSFVHHLVTVKDTTCKIVMLGNYVDQEKTQQLTGKLNEAFPEYSGDKQEIVIETINMGAQSMDPNYAMTIQQKLAAMIVAQEIDIFISDVEYLKESSKQALFQNLDGLYNTKYKDNFDKVEGKIELETEDEEEKKEFKDPHVYAIDITNVKYLNDLVYGDDLGISILANTKREEVAKEILDYLINNDIELTAIEETEDAE